VNIHTLVFVAVMAMLAAGCTDRPLDGKAGAPATPKGGPNVTRFEIVPAADSPHTAGKYDPATKAMTARKSEVGALLFGPYARLSPGQYRVTYRILAESEVDGAEVGAVDASGFIPGKPVEVLAQVPLKAARAEQSVTLNFVARNPDHLHEFRVWTNGKAKSVSVKSVLVEKL
jgi:hypothetical protein